MELILLFLKEIESEAKITKDFLNLVPYDKSDCEPCIYSSNMKSISIVIVEWSLWVELVLTTENHDVKVYYSNHNVETKQEILDLLETFLKRAKAVLVPENEIKLSEIWTLKDGDQIIFEQTKAECIRYAFNKIIHYRAMLTVYLKLCKITPPDTY